MIDEILDRLLTEKKQPVMSDIAKLWKEHGENMSMADYYENEGSRKGDDPAPYYKKAEKVYNATKAKFGLEMADTMVKHNDAMANTWYGHWDTAGEKKAEKIRKKMNIDWDGGV